MNQHPRYAALLANLPSAAAAAIFTAIILTPGLVSHHLWWASLPKPTGWESYWNSTDGWPYYSQSVVIAVSLLAAMSNALLATLVSIRKPLGIWTTLRRGYVGALVVLSLTNVLIIGFESPVRSPGWRRGRQRMIALCGNVENGRAAGLPGQIVSLWLPIGIGATAGVLLASPAPRPSTRPGLRVRPASPAPGLDE